MADYMLFMHNDTPAGTRLRDWQPYLDELRDNGQLNGGGVVGDGQCFRREGDPAALSRRIGGYLRVTADTLADARKLLAGNPVYEAGGTVEIRLLPKD